MPPTPCLAETVRQDRADVPFVRCPGGVRVAVRVAPRAARDGVQGLRTGADRRVALKVALTAAPCDGKANSALVALLAKLWRLPKSDFRIATGRSGRDKTLIIAGDGAALDARLRAWLARWRAGEGAPARSP